MPDDAGCRLIFGPTATWREEWRRYTPDEREEFVWRVGQMGIVVDGAFDPALPYPPNLQAAPGSLCYGLQFQDQPDSEFDGEDPVPEPTGLGEPSILPGVQTIPNVFRTILEWLRNVWRRLLSALEALAGLLGLSAGWLALILFGGAGLYIVTRRVR